MLSNRLRFNGYVDTMIQNSGNPGVDSVSLALDEGSIEPASGAITGVQVRHLRHLLHLTELA